MVVETHFSVLHFFFPLFCFVAVAAFCVCVCLCSMCSITFLARLLIINQWVWCINDNQASRQACKQTSISESPSELKWFLMEFSFFFALCSLSFIARYHVDVVSNLSNLFFHSVHLLGLSALHSFYPLLSMWVFFWPVIMLFPDISLTFLHFYFI